MKVAIVTALYYAGEHLPGLFGSIERMNYPMEDVRVIMIDNGNSPATRDWIGRNVTPKVGTTFPSFELIPTDYNTGFAVGNNLCIERAIALGCEAVYLLNEDAHGEPDFLRTAVTGMEADPTIGVVQSLMLLDPPERGTNSIGNAVHYLGFGYCDGYGMERHDAVGLLNVRALRRKPIDIGYASGGAVLMRTEALKKVGLFDADYFLYHEDLDLSWRIREAGYRVVIAPESVVYHKYEFKKSVAKFYWMERNRYRFCLEHYKWGTLALLLPAFLVSELGLAVFGIASGTLVPRLKAYGYMLNPAHWPSIWGKRQKVQSARTVSDRALFAHAVSDISFQDVQHPIMRIINPLMGAYWSVAKRLIVW